MVPRAVFEYSIAISMQKKTVNAIDYRLDCPFESSNFNLEFVVGESERLLANSWKI